MAQSSRTVFVARLNMPLVPSRTGEALVLAA
jgi:hypothetical protein